MGGNTGIWADALSSAAYGPEAALTLLIPVGAAGIAYIVPISVSIIVLLAIIFRIARRSRPTPAVERPTASHARSLGVSRDFSPRPH